MNHPHNHFYVCSEKHFPGIVWASIICHTLTAITILLPPESVQAAEIPTRNVPAVTHARKTYNIAAGPLETVLNHFGREAGILLTFSPDTTTGLQSTGLQGSYTLQEGLDRLLIGSNLYAVHDAKGKYSLHKRSKTSTAQENATMLTEMTVTGAAIDPGVTEGTGSYTTNQSSYGKGQNLKELPQTITVMTRQRIDDQQLKTLDDVLERTPGITVQKANSVSSSFYSRGFQITSFQIDGNSPTYGSGGQTFGLNMSQLDLAMFDRIEVLRGADALYGISGAPGGAINLVRKKPTKQFQVKALAHAGSWNNYRGELDVGGSIMAGRIRGRLVGVYEDRKYFYDFSKSDKALFYGIIEADITDSTMLTVGGDIMHQDFGGYNTFGLPRYSNGEDIGLRRSFYLGGPNDRWLRKNNRQFIRLDQAIGSNWTLGV
ncbi:TonB-dependent receptor plug domain-containing protein [Nitrosomonas sp.]|uniref:TonB-dependent siderophore receptor n=1 Tax=Nitrosomonas sp. TaxID=42353 RepID=UPI0033067ADC